MSTDELQKASKWLITRFAHSLITVSIIHFYSHKMGVLNVLCQTEYDSGVLTSAYLQSHMLANRNLPSIQCSIQQEIGTASIVNISGLLFFLFI